jgi:carbon storage regulator
MLVLTRKRSERIRIGEDVVITVIHTSIGSVKLGIDAPSNVRVLRAELNERPRTVSPAKSESCTEVAKPFDESISVERFLNAFDAEFVADIEEQRMLCMAT